MNDTLSNAISIRKVDINYYVDLILKDEKIQKDIVDLTLNHPHIMTYYHGYYILDQATKLKPEIFYKYWDEFSSLLKHENTYHRQIGIVLLSNLSNIDIDDKFSECINDYLNCLYDNKILIGKYCVMYLKNIFKSKPKHRHQIIDELLNHKRKTPYTEKQEALLEFYVLELIEENYQELKNKEEINKYIIEKQESISPKAKKKCKELIKKYKLS
ncbi:hypothetical protein [Methanobrevibacter sp. DSM 116169]|uniref:hypothetical protein n=1 Tax=Methanobrevibacter sp. DSM 116169 TaxID=3242727 RepID=UPI0038FC97FE